MKKEYIDNKTINDALLALTNLHIELEQRDLDLALQNTCIRLINYLGEKQEEGWTYNE